MRQSLVYDLPTRVFHWLFAGLFLTGFIIAKTIEDDSPWFSYHSIAGLTLGFVVILRIIWGVFGTKYARFSGFALNPMDLVNYFKGILSGDKTRWAGHNPASSWAGVIMMVMAFGLAVTGYFMTSGPDKESFEDIHELFANGFIIVVVLHIAGIVLHTIRHKELIALSMVDGKKAEISLDQTIPSAQSAFGILLIALIVAFGLNLFKNYDSAAGTLKFFGTTLQLSEAEGEDKNLVGEAEKNKNSVEKEGEKGDDD